MLANNFAGPSYGITPLLEVKPTLREIVLPGRGATSARFQTSGHNVPSGTHLENDLPDNVTFLGNKRTTRFRTYRMCWRHSQRCVLEWAVRALTGILSQKDVENAAVTCLHLLPKWFELAAAVASSR